MQRKSKRPKLNDEIIHTEYTYNRVNQGKVIQLLDMQFLYQMKDGSLELEPWEFCRCCLEPPSVIPSKDYKPKTDYDCNKSHY